MMEDQLKGVGGCWSDWRGGRGEWAVVEGVVASRPRVRGI